MDVGFFIRLKESSHQEVKFLPLDDEDRNSPTVAVETGNKFDLFELVKVNDLGFEEVHHSGTLEECEKLKRMLEANWDEEDE